MAAKSPLTPQHTGWFMTSTNHYQKKLIEGAIPLEATNTAAGRENNIHTGLPANLHTWWSRKPLGVARAALFCSLVDDPGESLPDAAATAKRDYLFSIAAALADIENSDNADLLD